AGYSQPTWPVGLGGRGSTRTEALTLSAAMAAAGVIAPPSGNGTNMAGPTILAHGTPEQQARYLGPIARGVADVVTKSIGTSNPYNMIRATFDALTEQTSPKSVAQRRGKKVADLLGRGGASAVEAEASAEAITE
ncbi:MAG: acyl-CoA dehydrogenase family protein, partial [Novosphingobium sp.]